MPDPTQPLIQIRLLGDFGVSVGGHAIHSLENARLQHLLAFLALHAGESVKRSRIAYTFWPDSEEKQALTNFRNLLHKLRQALPQIDQCLSVDSQSVTWRKDCGTAIDVQIFETAKQKAAAQSDPSEALPYLETAARSYRGPLLPDCYEDWANSIRDRLQLDAKKNLAQLVSALKAKGSYEEAIHYCRTLLQLDELSEPSHYALIELHALSGDRASALQAYKQCEAHLQKELEVEPGAELQDLHQRILNGDYETYPSYPDSNHPTDTPALETTPPAKASKTYPLLFAIAALVAIVAFVLYQNSSSSPVILEKSIAVLPFENRSSLSEDAFFTDGIHDDLITRISLIEDVKIISRTSVMQYRDSQQDLKEIAKELGVATIIEGGVQRSGNQIRINVQLIDASTGFHVWAENYTREITAEGIFSLQSEIADAVSTELHSVFNTSGQAYSKKSPTNNLAALEAYFYGRASGLYLTSEGLTKAIDHYKRAIELDPTFADAHAAIALAYLSQIYFSGKPVEAQTAIAQSHIAKALELNNTLSDAYVSLGEYEYYKTDYDAAEQAYRTAIELDPNNAQAYVQYAISRHYQFGDYQTALQLTQKARELAPRDPGPRMEQSSILMSLNRVEEAKLLLEELISEDPRNATAIGRLASLYDRSLNQYDEAVRLYRQAYALDPTSQSLSSQIAWLYHNLGDTEKFIYWSERDIAVAPASYKATFLQGYIHESRGQIAESLACFAALRKSDIFHDWSVYKVTSSAVLEGNYQEAIEGFTVAFPWVTNPDCDINSSNVVLAIDYVYLLQLNGRHEQSRALGDRVLKFLPQATRISNTGYLFFDAHLHIARGDTEAALSSIREYVEQGGCTALLEEEAYTRSLHDEPEFQRLLAKVDSRLAEQRQQIADWEANGELAPIPALEVSLGR